jgi:hypothetical protein
VIELWGPAMDAELAFRRDGLTNRTESSWPHMAAQGAHAASRMLANVRRSCGRVLQRSGTWHVAR